MDSFVEEPVDLLNLPFKTGSKNTFPGSSLQLSSHTVYDSSYSDASTAPPSPLPEFPWKADVTSSTPSLTTVQDTLRSSCPSEVDDVDQSLSFLRNGAICSRKNSIADSIFDDTASRRSSLDATSVAFRKLPSERLLHAREQFNEVVSKIKQLESEKNHVEELNNYNAKAFELQAHSQQQREHCVQMLSKNNHDLTEELRQLKAEVERRRQHEDELVCENLRLDVRVQHLEKVVTDLSTTRDHHIDQPRLDNLEKEVSAFQTEILEREVEALKQSNFCLKTENQSLARQIQELQDRLDQHERVGL